MNQRELKEELLNLLQIDTEVRNRIADVVQEARGPIKPTDIAEEFGDNQDLMRQLAAEIVLHIATGGKKLEEVLGYERGELTHELRKAFGDDSGFAGDVGAAILESVDIEDKRSAEELVSAVLANSDTFAHKSADYLSKRPEFLAILALRLMQAQSFRTDLAQAVVEVLKTRASEVLKSFLKTEKT